MELESDINSYYKKYKYTFEKGDGIYVYDKENRKIIDCFNGFGAFVLGHSHPDIMETAINFIKSKYIFQINDMGSEIRFRWDEIPHIIIAEKNAR